MKRQAGVPMQAIFRPKTARYQGMVSEVGSVAFEAARKKLSEMAGVASASDGDVFEALAIGWPAVKRHLARMRKAQPAS